MDEPSSKCMEHANTMDKSFPKLIESEKGNKHNKHKNKTRREYGRKNNKNFKTLKRKIK